MTKKDEKKRQWGKWKKSDGTERGNTVEPELTETEVDTEISWMKTKEENWIETWTRKKN